MHALHPGQMVDFTRVRYACNSTCGHKVSVTSESKNIPAVALSDNCTVNKLSKLLEPARHVHDHASASAHETYSI